MIGKNMALLNKNVVVNMEWHSIESEETDILKDVADRPVGIGNTYENGKFYRDGVEILTPMEALQKKLEELEVVNADQAAALTAIYAGTTEVSV